MADSAYNHWKVPREKLGMTRLMRFWRAATRTKYAFLHDKMTIAAVHGLSTMDPSYGGQASTNLHLIAFPDEEDEHDEDEEEEGGFVNER